MKQFLLLSICMLLALSSWAQWNYKQRVRIYENNSDTLTNYQALLYVDTQTLIGMGSMQASGDDIRFYASCDETGALPYFIEGPMNDDSTMIWVLVPQVLPNDSLDIWMFFGDSTATAASDFNATFPNAVVSGGSNVNLSGTQNIGWLQIDNGDTLFAGQGSVLDITARKAIIHGVIWGTGAGYAAPTSGPALGTGPGGGQAGSSSGAGGGGYGGNGGNGGYDSGDPINAGGTAYGSASSFAIQMGSSGGTASSVDGGNGGGAVMITAQFLMITGTVNVNGGEAQQPGGGQGAGGGAAGGFLGYADQVTFSGSVTANGGNGSVGTSTANDDGGGGGGGRIKFFYDASFDSTGSTAVTGGNGGPNGGTPAANGLPGSTYSQMMAFNEQTTWFDTINTHQNLVVSISDPDTVVCTNETLVISANPGFSNYEFFVNGASMQSGTTDTFAVSGLLDGDTVSLAATGDACLLMWEATVTVYPGITVSVTGNQTACEGDTVTLMASGSFASYSWNNGDTTTSTNVTATGSYVVTATDTNGCQAMDTSMVTFNPLPSPVISVTGNLLDAGAGYSSYQWNLNGSPIIGETNQTHTATVSGTYSVTVDSNGCSATSDTIQHILAGVETFTFGEDIEIYPNPSRGQINIRMAQPEQIAVIRITDLMGRNIMQLEPNGMAEVKIDLSDQPQGIYLLTVEGKQGAKATYRLVKE